MSLPLKIDDLVVRSDKKVLLSLRHLTLPTGSLTGIRGPSGAGKTTALHALAGLIPASGSLIWGRTDICRLSQRARTYFRGQQMGVLFQDFLLFEELTARDNALIAGAFRRDRPLLARRADALMERFHIAPLANRRTDQLSGGERQRVAVVRALVHSPAILLADEPTASLDRSAADGLIADLTAFVRDEGCTAVIVSHDENLWPAMDRMLTIRDGALEDEHA